MKEVDLNTSDPTTTSELSQVPQKDVQPPSTIFDLPQKQFRENFDNRVENRNLFLMWLRDNLTEGTDFDNIGFGNRKATKPTLLKGGAEKICALGGVTAHFPSLEEYEKLAMGGGDLNAIVIKCVLMQGGNIVGEGAGGRTLRQDRSDLNKYIKMCLKSAFIDATLRTFGLNGQFTQDAQDQGEVKSYLKKKMNDVATPTSLKKVPIKKPVIKEPSMTVSQKKAFDEYFIHMKDEKKKEVKEFLKTNPTEVKAGEMLVELRNTMDSWNLYIVEDDSMAKKHRTKEMLQEGMNNWGLSQTKVRDIITKTWKKKEKKVGELSLQQLEATIEAIKNGKITPFVK